MQSSLRIANLNKYECKGRGVSGTLASSACVICYCKWGTTKQIESER